MLWTEGTHKPESVSDEVRDRSVLQSILPHLALAALSASRPGPWMDHNNCLHIDFCQECRVQGEGRLIFPKRGFRCLTQVLFRRRRPAMDVVPDRPSGAPTPALDPVWRGRATGPFYTGNGVVFLPRCRAGSGPGASLGGRLFCRRETSRIFSRSRRRRPGPGRANRSPRSSGRWCCS
jgi:hypothetical protein